MNNLILVLIVATLSACNSDQAPEEIELVVKPDFCPDYILTGQSNATRDYSHFDDITGFSVQKIAVGGLTIKQLIDDLKNNEICSDNLKGILLIHGEHDALWSTPPDEYIKDVEKYRLMIKDVPLFLSLVGYTTNPEEDYLFDVIREAQLNSGHSVSYTDTHRFREWGFISDNIHFNQLGRDVIAEAFAEDIWDGDM